MATTKFNEIIKEAARRLKDPRSDASAAGDTGRRYTSAILARYANKAVRDFLTEEYKALGRRFGDVFPEYMRTSGGLVLVAGAVAKPGDAFMVTDLNKSDYLLRFAKLRDDQVELVRGGADGIVVPSVADPVFWVEGLTINVLPAGVGAYTVIARYIKVHTDIVPVTGATGNGNFQTVAGSYVAATRRLLATMNAGFATGDVGKRVMFRTATIVYEGIIEQRIGAGEVQLRAGDNLPAADIANPLVVQVMVSDKDPDAADLALSDNWFGEIVDRTVAMGRDDAAKGVVR